MASDEELLKKVYQQFSPAPLGADEQGLYVDLEAVRGNTGFVETLATPILLGNEPTCQLLTGHMGSGKSTELQQLKARLRASESVPLVIICDVSKELNPADLDYPDLLIMILRGLAIELEPMGISLQTGFFQKRAEWFKRNLLQEADLNGLKLKVGMAELTGILQHSPETKRKLRAFIDPETDSWIEAANDLIGKAKLELRKKGVYQDLVILVDGLDKMSRDDHAKGGCSIGEHLYIERKKELFSLMCHVVYTIPLYLAYSSSAHKITSLYGVTDIPVVPVTKVRERPPAGGPYEPGVEQFREVVRRRLDNIGATEKDIFESGAMDRLIELSGGQLRELIIMTRDAAVTRLPINDEAIERVANNPRRVYARWLERKHWAIIQEVRKTGRIARTDENASAADQLLDSRAILHYRNATEWFGDNPLLPEPPPDTSE